MTMGIYTTVQSQIYPIIRRFPGRMIFDDSDSKSGVLTWWLDGFVTKCLQVVLRIVKIYSDDYVLYFILGTAIFPPLLWHIDIVSVSSLILKVTLPIFPDQFANQETYYVHTFTINIWASLLALPKLQASRSELHITGLYEGGISSPKSPSIVKR